MQLEQMVQWLAAVPVLRDVLEDAMLDLVAWLEANPPPSEHPGRYPVFDAAGVRWLMKGTP